MDTETPYFITLMTEALRKEGYHFCDKELALLQEANMSYTFGEDSYSFKNGILDEGIKNRALRSDWNHGSDDDSKKSITGNGIYNPSDQGVIIYRELDGIYHLSNLLHLTAYPALFYGSQKINELDEQFFVGIYDSSPLCDPLFIALAKDLDSPCEYIGASEWLYNTAEHPQTVDLPKILIGVDLKEIPLREAVPQIASNYITQLRAWDDEGILRFRVEQSGWLKGMSKTVDLEKMAERQANSAEIEGEFARFFSEIGAEHMLDKEEISN